MSAVPKAPAGAPLPSSPVTLDDKYLLDHGRVYLTGTQALVRLPMIQRQRDLAAGLNTAGFLLGYRRPPPGGPGQAGWGGQEFPHGNPLFFIPGGERQMR